jgi:hypothetical protein
MTISRMSPPRRSKPCLGKPHGLSNQKRLPSLVGVFSCLHRYGLIHLDVQNNDAVNQLSYALSRMFTEISDAQREAVAASGLPLPLLDRYSGKPYLLFTVNVTPAPVDGVQASVDGIAAIGEGETPEDAILALSEALREYLDVFGDA